MATVTPLTAEEIDAAGEFDDIGTIELADEESRPSPEEPPARATEGEPSGPDEPPAHARKRKRETGPKAAPAKIRVTAGIRTDIHAKISMPLEIAGQVWAARDQLCGGTFLQQRTRIADSLTEIVCGSPALVAWFTGPVGGFMLYLDLAAALWPVLEVVAAHHVYHSVETAPEDAGQSAARPAYAA